MLNYNNYTATVEFSEEDALLVGQLNNVDALVVFSADNVADLITEFHAAVDTYLADCAEAGIDPEKPYKGSFNVRVGVERHRRAACTAARWSVSLNEFVGIAIDQAVDRNDRGGTVTLVKEKIYAGDLSEQGFESIRVVDDAVGSIYAAAPYTRQ
ncbi:MAG: hypothetical protein A3E01_05880 [Gammaproteobacteria bacterium RIFCSPHIGHO2_12_FULL_63_22]|nr:MAG: hypothetical protein A3E01_05880 [Gammaproteobacteria bacterium RIFCSPHIGHO2_12_FULL_63_22]